MGSTGNLPVPVGYQPTGTGGGPRASGRGLVNMGRPSHAAGLVAQRHGQVARATQTQAPPVDLRRLEWRSFKLEMV